MHYDALELAREPILTLRINKLLIDRKEVSEIEVVASLQAVNALIEIAFQLLYLLVGICFGYRDKCFHLEKIGLGIVT